MICRDYQAATVDSFFQYWEDGPQEPGKAWGNPVAALPTGTGKALIIAEFIRRAWETYPGTRVLMLCHIKELIEQNFNTLLRVWPTAPAGIYSAGLNRKDISKPITFAGIGSVAKNAHWFKPDIILIDECHTVSPKETTTYQKVISACREVSPHLKVAGLSATPYRLGQGMLIEPGGIFNNICFDLTTKDAFNWFISEGYLKRLVPRATRTEYDISGVHISSTGDYNPHELQAAVDKEDLNRLAVAEMLEQASSRNCWLVFCAGIEHAEHITRLLVENGIAAICIHSKSTKQERDEGLQAYRAGKVRALVNNGCFTTGLDVPQIDYISILRHTTSPGLWVQMLGRGTRPVWNGPPPETREERLAVIAAGVPDCLVSDFAKNTERLGPINDVRKPQARKKKDVPGDAPCKSCEICLAYNYASARVCCECGAEFPVRLKLQTKASEAELIAGNAEPVEPLEEWFEVETVSYSIHIPWTGRSKIKQAKPSLRVTYSCKGTVRAFSEYICFEHGGHASTMARQFWTIASRGLTIPQTTQEAFEKIDTLRQPVRIRVWVNRKNPQIQFKEYE
jgi:DNA repair protein RadD